MWYLILGGGRGRNILQITCPPLQHCIKSIINGVCNSAISYFAVKECVPYHSPINMSKI
jgi:hypothetical protein